VISKRVFSSTAVQLDDQVYRCGTTPGIGQTSPKTRGSSFANAWEYGDIQRLIPLHVDSRELRPLQAIAVVNDSHSSPDWKLSTGYIISLSSIDQDILANALRAHGLEEIRLEFSRCGYYRVDPTLCTPDIVSVSTTSSRFSIMTKRVIRRHEESTTATTRRKAAFRTCRPDSG
jgi:hypothetical protein